MILDNVCWLEVSLPCCLFSHLSRNSSLKAEPTDLKSRSHFISADNKTGSNMDLTERGLIFTTESALTSTMFCRYRPYLRKNRIMSLVSMRCIDGALLACLSTWPDGLDSAGIVTSGSSDV